MENKTESKKMVTDVFVEGAKKGWGMGVNSIVPNVIMAYVLIRILNISGALTLLGKLFAPAMALFGLPGEAAAVLMGAWMSMGGGVGVAVSLFNEGLLNGNHITILIPAIFLMGAQLQYAGRLLGTAGVNPRHYGPLMIISIINAFIAMFIMKFFV